MRLLSCICHVPGEVYGLFPDRLKFWHRQDRSAVQKAPNGQLPFRLPPGLAHSRGFGSGTSGETAFHHSGRGFFDSGNIAGCIDARNRGSRFSSVSGICPDNSRINAISQPACQQSSVSGASPTARQSVSQGIVSSVPGSRLEDWESTCTMTTPQGHRFHTLFRSYNQFG